MAGGWTDTPLTDLGRKQAKLIGDKLKEEIVDNNECAFYSSDLLRAAQTAEIIGNQINLKVIENKGLREINTGVATGKTKDWARENRLPRKNSGFDLDIKNIKMERHGDSFIVVFVVVWIGYLNWKRGKIY